MQFLWTIIPFREFIEKYNNSNVLKNLPTKLTNSDTGIYNNFNEKIKVIDDGFKAIKQLFDLFKNNDEPIIIKNIYKGVFDAFVKKKRNNNTIINFGEEQSSGELLNDILKYTNFEINSIYDIHNIPDENYNKYIFIIEFVRVEQYNFYNYEDVKEINHDNKTFKIKAFISYQGNLSNEYGNSGHYVCYVFDDNGENPFMLDDFDSKKEHVELNKLNKTLINSMVLYKRVFSTDASKHTSKSTTVTASTSASTHVPASSSSSSVALTAVPTGKAPVTTKVSKPSYTSTYVPTSSSSVALTVVPTGKAPVTAKDAITAEDAIVKAKAAATAAEEATAVVNEVLAAAKEAAKKVKETKVAAAAAVKSRRNRRSTKKSIRSRNKSSKRSIN